MATYHVDETGSNANSGLSTGTAWQTLDYALTQVSSGDTINLYNGTNGRIEIGAINNLTIQCPTPRSYKIAFGGVGERGQPGVKIQNPAAYNITFDGLEVTSEDEMPDESLFVGQYDNLTALNSAHPGPHPAGTWGAIGTGGPTRAFWNGSAWVASGTAWDTEIQMGYGFLIVEAKQITVKNCYIHHCGGNGIGSAYNDHLKFIDNEIHDCARWDPNQTSCISVYEADDMTTTGTWSSTANILIQGNTCYESRVRVKSYAGQFTDGNGIIQDDFDNSQGGRGGGAFTGTTIIENNICYLNGFKGIQMFISSNVTCRFNTVYANHAAYANEFDTSSGQEGEIHVGFTNNAYVHSNIAVVNGAVPWSTAIQAFAAVVGASEPGCVWEYNLAYEMNPDAQASIWNADYPGDNYAVFESADGNILDQNPLFTNAAGGDFSLQAASPAIGAGLGGADIGAIPYAIGGNISPTASFTATPTTGAAPLSVDVDASASSDPDGTIASYVWAWGDATANGSGETASHTYTAAGTYTITLTITDNEGATDTDTAVITVSEAEAATGGNMILIGGLALMSGSNTIVM